MLDVELERALDSVAASNGRILFCVSIHRVIPVDVSGVFLRVVCIGR